MKFTDGYWQLRKGVTMLRPAEAYDVAAAGDRLTIYAPARPVGQPFLCSQTGESI